MSQARLQGYIGSREFGGNFVPQRVQNLVIKNYIYLRNDEYILSATEYGLKNCYMMLSALSKELCCDGIVFYSVFLLPSDLDLRNEYLKTFITRGKTIHFALEGIVIEKDKELEKIHDIFFAKKIQEQIKIEPYYFDNLKAFLK